MGGRKAGGANARGTPASAAPQEDVEVSSKDDPVAILAGEYGSVMFESSETESVTDPGNLKRKSKRKNHHFGKVKKVDRNKKQRDDMNELKERARLDQIAHLKEKLGDPFDDLDFVQTKRMVVSLYLSLSEKFGDDVYDLVGEMVDHTRRWVYETVEKFKEDPSSGFCDSRSGKTFQLASPIQDQQSQVSELLKLK